MKLSGWITFLAVGAALAGLLAAAECSIRMGWADYLMRQEQVAATEKAIRLSPDQSEYHARLAWLVSQEDPARAKAALQRAVVLNPWDTRSWIELGLIADRAGDSKMATGYLLRAADTDREFLPRWSLANYYFRHDDEAMFWFWAKAAGKMVYGDVQPLFRLCGRVREDGKLIDRLEIRNPDVRAAYLCYLFSQDRIDLCGPAVHRLLQDGRLADDPLLLIACERLLDARRVTEGVEIWNRLAAAGRVPFRTPAGQGDQLLANDSFSVTPSSQGFDWRLPVVEGVSVSQEENARGLRLTFSGRQPETCEPLLQLVPLQWRMPYVLRFLYQTRGIKSAGLAWRVTDTKDGAILAEGPVPASDVDREAAVEFTIPADCHLVRVALWYRRAPGTTRFDGFLVLRKVTLKASAQLPMDGSRVRK